MRVPGIEDFKIEIGKVTDVPCSDREGVYAGGPGEQRISRVQNTSRTLRLRPQGSSLLGFRRPHRQDSVAELAQKS